MKSGLRKIQSAIKANDTNVYRQESSNFGKAKEHLINLECILKLSGLWEVNHTFQWRSNGGYPRLKEWLNRCFKLEAGYRSRPPSGGRMWNREKVEHVGLKVRKCNKRWKLSSCRHWSSHKLSYISPLPNLGVKWAHTIAGSQAQVKFVNERNRKASRARAQVELGSPVVCGPQMSLNCSSGVKGTTKIERCVNSQMAWSSIGAGAAGGELVQPLRNQCRSKNHSAVVRNPADWGSSNGHNAKLGSVNWEREPKTRRRS